jgi:hypothetical protein
MGFVDVFVTLLCITVACLYFLYTNTHTLSECTSEGVSEWASGAVDSLDCSSLQWSAVSPAHVSESNALLLSSSALLWARRVSVYTVLASVLSIVIDPGEEALTHSLTHSLTH